MTPEEEEQLRQFRLGGSTAVNADMTTAQGPVSAPSSSLLGEIAASVPTAVGPDRGSTLIVQDAPSGLPRLDLPAQEVRSGRNGEVKLYSDPPSPLFFQSVSEGTGRGSPKENVTPKPPLSGIERRGGVAPQPMQQAAELPTMDAVATDTQPEPVVLQSPAAREADPIRSTFTLPSGEVVMERQSGERFTPTSDQLESFSSVMQDLGQPSNEQAPMSMAETRSMLQERFGAPTISAIQALPAGQGLGLPTDAQGRMITPGAQPPATALSDFEQASLERQQRIGGTGSFEGDSAAREERLAERDRRPGETRTERDTRIARSRTEGARAGALTMADAVDLAGGDRTLARTMVVRSRRGLDPMTGKEQFVPREVTIEGNRYIQLTPEYFQPVAQDTPEETRLEQTLKNLEADLASGRLTQGEYDIAVQNAKDVYIGLDKKAPSKTQEGEVEGVIQQTIAEGESQPDSIPTITSQEEYDKLPKGSRYIDSEGKSAIKR